MAAILERELRSYFTNMTGYVFGAFLLLFGGIYFMAYNLKSGYPNFEFVLESMRTIFLVAIPVLTMRAIAEEKRQRTDQLLYALPIGMTRVVIGKYLAMLVVIAVPTVILGVYPLILSAYGTVSLRIAYCALVGFFFLAAALAAIGLLLSSLTENQAVAAGLCFIVMLLLFFMGNLSNMVSGTALASLAAFGVALVAIAVAVALITRSTPVALGVFVLGGGGLIAAYVLNSTAFEGAFARVMDGLSLFERMNTFVDGVFDLTAIVYYVTVIIAALFLSIQGLEKRRWS